MPTKPLKDCGIITKYHKDVNNQIIDCSTPEGRERFKAILMSKGWRVGKDKKLRPAQEQGGEKVPG